MTCSYPDCTHKAHYCRVVQNTKAGVTTRTEQVFCNDHWWNVEEPKP